MYTMPGMPTPPRPWENWLLQPVPPRKIVNAALPAPPSQVPQLVYQDVQEQAGWGTWLAPPRSEER